MSISDLLNIISEVRCF